jgi:hypothetical protein
MTRLDGAESAVGLGLDPHDGEIVVEPSLS